MGDVYEYVDGYDNSNAYSDDMVFEVSKEDKSISVIKKQVLISGERNSQYIEFQMPRYYDGIDLSEKNIEVIYVTETGVSDINKAINVRRSEEQILFGWLVPGGALQDPGTLSFCIEFAGEEYVMKTMPVEIEVYDGMNGTDIMVEPTDQVWYMQIQNLCSQTLEKAQEHETNAATSETNAQTYMQDAQKANEQANQAKESIQGAVKQITNNRLSIEDLEKENEQLKTRLDTAVGNYTGSEEGEIADARIDRSGKVYGALGAAIRGQLDEQENKLKKETDSLKEDLESLENDINPLTWNDGFMLQNGKAVATNGRSVSDFCLCPSEAQIEYVSETENQYVQGIVFYDKHKEPIIGYWNNGKNGEPCTVTSPKDTYYLRLSVTNGDIGKAFFKSSISTIKHFIEESTCRQITVQDTDFAEIETTNYMLVCDIIKNKAYVVNNNVYAGLKDSDNKDSSTLCVLDKTKDMYSGNKYSTDVIFFDSDRNFISITNKLYLNVKLSKEQYPSNAKYVAFTWAKDGVIADRMYISTVDNAYQTGLPALKYGKTIKYKGQRPNINIYNSDTQEEIFDKLADACYTQDCDVYFEKGTYVFDIIYDKIKTYYNSVGDAFEMLLGGNCRYYMYGCTFKGDFTNSTVKCSTFGTHRHSCSYELFGGTIICVDGVYCVHDEASGEEPISVRKYHHVTFKYVKGSTYSNWICKCLGCGTGKNTITVIDGCYFESDNDLCAAEASWHGNNSDNSACETFIEVKNSYFKNKGFYVDAIPSSSKQVGKIIFCNNSVENKIPTESNGWILAGWNNEIRNPR